MPLKTSADAGLAIPKADTAAIAAAVSPWRIIMVTPFQLPVSCPALGIFAAQRQQFARLRHQLCACPSCATVATQRTRRIDVRRGDLLGHTAALTAQATLHLGRGDGQPSAASGSADSIDHWRA